MKTLVLASRNKHKIEELQETLKDIDIQLKSALDFPELKEVEEDRPTLEGNALKKAQHVYKVTGLPALSDDTGLEVDALGGRPGVFSARYAGEDASYQDNLEKLLEELAGVAPEDRKAQFRTVVALISDKGAHTFEGVCRGVILSESRGNKGFGYDPVFQPEGYTRTFAELEPGIKNGISRKGLAIKKLRSFLISS
jgi:XTP/dITP diphosphohydrolase